VHLDRARAARFMSARLLLPLVLLPVFGVAVALALLGFLVAGLALFAVAFAVRLAVRASSGGFVLRRALEEPDFYRQALEAEVIRVEAPADTPQPGAG
jgi:hypothetical protein